MVSHTTVLAAKKWTNTSPWPTFCVVYKWREVTSISGYVQSILYSLQSYPSQHWIEMINITIRPNWSYLLCQDGIILSLQDRNCGFLVQTVRYYRLQLNHPSVRLSNIRDYFGCPTVDFYQTSPVLTSWTATTYPPQVFPWFLFTDSSDGHLLFRWTHVDWM